jgi:hypothetical protein
MKTRYWIAVVSVAVAGSLAAAQQAPPPPINIYEGGQFRTVQPEPAPPPLPPGPPPAERWSGHLSYVIGYKGLESAWAPVRDQFEFGALDLDFKPPHWPVSFVFQTLLSYADDIPNQPGFLGDYCGTYEFNFGLRKIWDRHPRLQPFVSGGVSVLGASTTTDWGWWWYETEDSDTDIGWWVSGGVYYNITPGFHIGAQVEYSDGDIELFGQKLNAGGLHALFMIGLHW